MNFIKKVEEVTNKYRDTLSEIPNKYYWAIIPFTLILVGFSVYSLRNFQVKLSFFDELPSDDPYVERFRYVAENYGGTDFVFVAIEGEPVRRLKDCARAFERELRLLPEIKSVRGKLDIEFFKKHALYFLDERELKDFVDFLRRREFEFRRLFLELRFPDFISNWAKIMTQEILEREKFEGEEDEFVEFVLNMRKWLTDVKAGVLGEEIDPERYKRNFSKSFFVASGNSRREYSVDEEFLMSPDMKAILISVFPNKPADDYGFNRIIYDRVFSVKEKLEKTECVGLKTYIGGNYIVLEEQRRVVLQDMQRGGLLSFFAITLCFLIVYGSLASFIILNVYLVIGLAITFGFLMLTYGYVTVISAMFGAFLMGMGINYGVYVLSRPKENKIENMKESVKETVYFLSPAIFSEFTTTAFAFLCLLISEIEGVKILSLVSGIGVMIYALVAMLFLPSVMNVKPVYRLIKKEKVLDYFDKLYKKFSYVAESHPWAVIVSFLALIPLVVVGLPKFGFEYNLRKVFPKLNAIESEDYMIEKFGRSKDYQVITAEDFEDLKHKVELIEKKETFGKVESVLTFFPKDMSEKVPYVEEVFKVVKDVRLGAIPEDGLFSSAELYSAFESMYSVASALSELAVLSGFFKGEDEVKILKKDISDILELVKQRESFDISRLQRVNYETVREFLSDIKLASESSGFALEELPEDIKKQFIGKDGSFIIFAYPERTLWEDERYMRKNVMEALEISRSAFGIATLFLHIADRVKRDFAISLALAYMICLIFAYITFRNVKLALIAMLPVTISEIVTASICSLLGLKIHYINMGAYAIIVGSGIDYGLHMVHRLTEEKSFEKATVEGGKVVLVAALTTVIGFMALVIARFRGLQHLGITIAIGITISMITTFILMPAIFSLVKGKHRSSS